MEPKQEVQTGAAADEHAHGNTKAKDGASIREEANSRATIDCWTQIGNTDDPERLVWLGAKRQAGFEQVELSWKHKQHA
jgi:hypothetical protein